MATTTFPERTDAASTATAGKDYLIHVNKGRSDLEPDWLLVGGQRTGNLNRKADELDASHKTSGGWACHLPGLRSWSIDLESVVLLNDEGAHYLEAAFNAGRQVHLKFEYPDKSYYTGWGSITEFSLNTQHDDVATISGTISGDGPLSELQRDEEETTGGEITGTETGGDTTGTETGGNTEGSDTTTTDPENPSGGTDNIDPDTTDGQEDNP
ncbi:MAG: phage tail tube protein [Succiniclasticum sp.]|uniref:phage tail tube protein n=1 Tax=Succiniclasticum sp. TaxID=2775030 RepID=UPI002A90A1FE|nr:phage tail tube protein [Succiniclasticum sp.]MDY6289853.1 phage tail tube protein [Succiniclasticum sp.]